MKALELSGMLFGLWRAVERRQHRPGRHAVWACECRVCGDERLMSVSHVVSWYRVACKTCTTQKRQDRRLAYASWQNMKTRATNPARKEYLHYSALGVHAAWLKDFEAFFAHVGPRASKDLTLERLDNNRGYFPGNVVWADRKTQARNTRRNVMVKVKGAKMLAADAAVALGVSRSTLDDVVHGRRKTVLEGLQVPYKDPDDRNLKREYALQVKRGEHAKRMERQRARRALDAKGVDRTGKDVSHNVPFVKGGDNSDGYKLESPSKNRARNYKKLKQE